jgi:hypothetical protein
VPVVRPQNVASPAKCAQIRELVAA